MHAGRQDSQCMSKPIVIITVRANNYRLEPQVVTEGPEVESPSAPVFGMTLCERYDAAVFSFVLPVRRLRPPDRSAVFRWVPDLVVRPLRHVMDRLQLDFVNAKAQANAFVLVAVVTPEQRVAPMCTETERPEPLRRDATPPA